MRSSLRSSNSYHYHGEQQSVNTQTETNTVLRSDFVEDQSSSYNINHNYGSGTDDMNTDNETLSSFDTRTPSRSPHTNAHIAAVLRDAAKGDVPPNGREPKRTSTPLKSKLTHYSSADEILQRFSQKWRRPEEQRQVEDEAEELDSNYSVSLTMKLIPAHSEVFIFLNGTLAFTLN